MIGELREALDGQGFTPRERASMDRQGARSAAAQKDFEAKHPRGGKGSAAGGKFVRKGSGQSNQVRAVQRKVGAKVDGAFGAKTDAKVREFQRRKGLTADGVVGHATAKALAGEKASKKDEGALTAADRERLKSRGKVREAEVGKPGTNWKQVTPEAKKKLSGILAHYRKSAHPFGECVADNTKRFGPDRAKRICAVVKDLNMRTTKWRKGGNHGSVAEEAVLDALVIAAAGRIEAIEAALGEGSAVAVAESAPTGDVPFDKLAEGAFADLSVLALAEHPLGEALAVADQARHRDGQFTNVTARVTKSKDVPALVSPDGELRVNTEPAPVEESFISGLLEARDPSKIVRDRVGRFADVPGVGRDVSPRSVGPFDDSPKARQRRFAAMDDKAIQSRIDAVIPTATGGDYAADLATEAHRRAFLKYVEKLKKKGLSLTDADRAKAKALGVAV